MRPVPVAALVLIATLGPGGAAEVGDAEAGLAIARDTCAECHVVERGDTSRLYEDVPSFQEIANLPEMSRLALVSFFQTSHESMPDFMLSPVERDDLLAYILGLR